MLTNSEKNELKTRIDKYYKISTELAHIDKKQLDILLNDKKLSNGWGKNHIIKLGNSRVFVKRIPVTDIEYNNMFSTLNHYNLPMYYNYGVGSAGFGAFRELVTHIKTTNWVLEGEIENFPLMYHYRVVPCSDKNIETDMEKHKQYIKYWNNNKNINQYIIDRKSSNYEIILFLEYIPYTVSEWLVKNKNKVTQLIDEMLKTIAFLKKNGIIHMDIHFDNIITDGKKMFLTDFGLALDQNFDLSEKEKVFFKNNTYYDFGEFLYSISVNLFFIYKKNNILERLKIAGINEEMKSFERYIFFLKNIKEISGDKVIQMDKNYFNIIIKYYDIILLISEFLGDMYRNNKKNTKYNHLELLRLLKTTELLRSKNPSHNRKQIHNSRQPDAQT